MPNAALTPPKAQSAHDSAAVADIQPTPGPKLTVKQQRFIDAYCGDARFNKAEAARLAGYSEKSARTLGSDLYKTPHIRARIDEILAENTLSAPEVLHEITDVAMRELSEFIEITKYDREGNPIATRMDLSAKMKALEMLGKHHQLFTDNVQHGGSITVEIAGIDVEQL